MGTQEELAALCLVTCCDEFLGIVEALVHEGALAGVETLHIGLELHVLGIVLGLGYRTGYDERGTGIVDEHRVYLINDGVMMLALDKVLGAGSHVVAEVVETELVVGTEGDVAVICALALVAVGLMLVDTVHGQAMEHVERSHPLGVTLGQVVVDGNYVDSLAGEGVEEDRERSDEGLALAGGHLGDLALMQDGTADELHVIMDHVPGDLIAAGDPVVLVYGGVAFDMYEVVIDTEVTVELGGGHLDELVLRETACSGLHDGESLRKDLVEALLDGLVLVLHKLVRLGGELFLLGHGEVSLQCLADLLDARLERSLHFAELLPEGG